jgi:hypothetical protein
LECLIQNRCIPVLSTEVGMEPQFTHERFVTRP